MGLPVALQIYSVRDDLDRDFVGTLRKVKEMGYDGVELPGLGKRGGKEVKTMLDDAGLSVMSSHVPFGAIAANPKNVFEEYRAAGCRYVAIPWLDMRKAPGGEDFGQILPDILQMGKTALEHGITLLYHNHDFEFRKIGGKYALDVLYESIPQEYLKTQIDTCWVKVAGADPAEYLRKYKGRAPLVHLKDFVMGGKVTGGMYELIGKDGADKKTGSGEFDFRPVGHGVQDIPAILEACEYVGAEWVIVEQDASTQRPPLEAAKMSREYLKDLGW